MEAPKQIKTYKKKEVIQVQSYEDEEKNTPVTSGIGRLIFYTVKTQVYKKKMLVFDI